MKDVIIEPTVGRVVLYHPGESDPGYDGRSETVLAATIAWVFTDTRVNLTVHAPNGSVYGREGVYLLQLGGAKPAAGIGYAAWMPYQLGQAARTEQIAAKLAVQDRGEIVRGVAAAVQQAPAKDGEYIAAGDNRKVPLPEWAPTVEYASEEELFDTCQANNCAYHIRVVRLDKSERARGGLVPHSHTIVTYDTKPDGSVVFRAIGAG